jgi:methionine synthase II (cobalamin-independent)
MSNLFKNAVQRNIPPFRADIVGSFLRPQTIKQARSQFQNGELSAHELTHIEDEEIIQLVEKQKQIGLQAVTDGEFRRSWWHLDFMWGLDGVEKRTLETGYKFNNLETRAETACLTGKVGFSNHPMLEHYKFIKNIVGDTVVARQTLPAPAQFLAELQRAENKAITEAIYPDLDELIVDIANAYKAAIQAFYDLGCRNLQLDDCTWGMLCDEKYWKARQNEGVNITDLAKLNAKLTNLAIQDHPKDLVITMHVCRGNYHSTWASSGGYEPIAETLFGTVNVDGFYLEYDTDRAGDFKPLRFIKNQQVVLGLVSSKTGELENKEDILKKIERATEYLNINQICLSPQCGFASTEEGNVLTEEQQWNKLILIKEIADTIWK